MIIFLNFIIVVNMFAISLNLRISDFKVVIKHPKTVLVGLTAQFFLLPLITFFFTLVLPINPTVALAFIMVSCVPGGNLSNVFTFLARGNLPVSVGMTAVGFPIAVLLTPINFGIYTNLHPEIAPMVSAVRIDPFNFVTIISLNVLLPLLLGCWVGSTFKTFYAKVAPYIATFALISIGAIIVIIFKDNLHIPLKVSKYYMPYTVLHHAVVLISAYYFSSFFKVSDQDKRTIAIENGIQNAPIGLVLLLTFMPTLSGAAITIAFWGAWQIFSTFWIAMYWRKHDLNPELSKSTST